MRLLDQFNERAEELRVLNVRVLKDGEQIAEGAWDSEIRRNQYSATKTFTSAAVGLAVKEGLLSLSEKVSEAFDEDMPRDPSEYLLQLTVRDLLTMCAGQGEGHLMGEKRPFLEERNWVRYALGQPFAYRPGTRFVYNNTGPYLAGILVQRRAGCNLVDYLYPRLFKPLGIQRPTWETDPSGNTFGAGGLFLCVRELARFMQLYLQEGRWDGKQILTGEWVRESTAHQADNGRDEYGYGYLIWRGPHGSYRCDGKYGQYGIVVPEKRAVIAINAECREQNKLLEHVYETLLPML